MIWGAQQQPGAPDYFFWDLLRKYVVVFGRTFSDIVIQRSVANNVVTDIKVPLEYAAKEKTLVRLEGDPNLERPFSALLPIMTFELGSPAIEYDPDQRKINTLAKVVTVSTSNNNQLQVMYSPVPYNINFNLYIYVKNQEDGAKILEQILPFFQPDWTPKVELIPQFNEIRNIPIEIGAVQTQDMYDDKFTTRRLILYTIPFRVRGLFYGPERNKPVIKFTTLNVRPGGVSSGSEGGGLVGAVGGPLATGFLNENFTNNQITMTYSGANGNFQSNDNTYVYAYYANNTLMANGTINLASYQNATGNTGTLVINTIFGSFANATSIVAVSANNSNCVANVTQYWNGIFDTDGNLLVNPGIAEYITGQPGKTASGQATTNVNSSVAYSLINIDDDYGFATAVIGVAD